MLFIETVLRNTLNEGMYKNLSFDTWGNLEIFQRNIDCRHMPDIIVMDQLRIRLHSDTDS